MAALIIIYNKVNGQSMSVKEFGLMLYNKREIRSSDIVMTKDIIDTLQYFVIDTTGTAYKLDKEKYQIYE